MHALNSFSALTTPAKIRWSLGLFILLSSCLVLGAYATALNRLFYTTYGPFYDSMSYFSAIGWIIETGRTAGISEAFRQACTNSTVFLPFGIAALLSPVLPVDRAVGVWLQIPFVFVLLVSLWIYFRVRLEAGPVLAAILALPAASITAIYQYNGGISDFRMDLMLYLMAGSASLWLFIALHRGNITDWLLCGLLCALASLSRATAVIYLFVIFAPVLCAHFVFQSKKRRQILIGACLVGATWLVFAAWFFFLNYDQLYFYYFVWNTDANAKLPISQSVQHFVFAARGVGFPVFIAGVIAGVIGIVFSASPRPLRLKEFPGRFPWELLWLALAPAGFLTLRGAGLNPFVSMPTALGIVLLPLALPVTWRNLPLKSAMAVALVVALGCMVSAWRGWDLHAHPRGYVYRAKPFEDVTRAIRTSFSPKESEAIAINTLGCGSIVPMSVENYLTFDARFIPQANRRLKDPATGHVTAFNSVRGTDCATLIEWQQRPGSTDEERIDLLANEIAQSSDLLLLPTKETADYMLSKMRQNYINIHAGKLREAILEKGKWIVLQESLEFSRREKYILLKNAGR